MPKSKPVQWEHMEQVNLVTWFKLQYPQFVLFAIPNGGSRDCREAINLRRSGVTSGIPDLCLPVSRKGHHGVFIELKRRFIKGSPRPATSAAQKEMISHLNAQNYLAKVCYGFEEAQELLRWYLND